MSPEPVPFSGWSGGRNPRMLILGEAWGENEAKLRRPFVGYSGQELWRMLGEALPTVFPELHASASGMFRYDLAWVKPREAWLAAAGVAFANVFNLRPAGNKIEELCASKKEVAGGQSDHLPPLARAMYLREEFLPELHRLRAEIESTKPNLVLALGNTACWATLGLTNISSIRGTVALATSGQKVLPSFHPAGVLRQWSWRPIVVADIIKAWREAQFPELRRPRRTVLVNPSREEMETWVRGTLAAPPPILACDIETAKGQITCVGFARSEADAIVIPFHDPRRPDGNYWPTEPAELTAWNAVKALLESGIPLVGQNFIYDMQYLTQLGIFPRNPAEDTMLLHHAILPEMRKSLGFLGSVYTDEASWKLMRRSRVGSGDEVNRPATAA